jgi:outer membrane protein TolC
MNSTPHRPTRAHAAWLLPIVAAFAACSGSPPPQAVVQMPDGSPDAWRSDSTHKAEREPLPLDWWRIFGDPQLDAHVEAALQHNKSLQATAARVLAANEQAILQGAAGLPQVDAGLDATRSRRVFVGFPFGAGGGVPSNTATILNANITIRWELDLWSRLASAEAAALADAQAASADFAAAQTSLIAQVCKAHFALIEAREQLRLFGYDAALPGVVSAGVELVFEGADGAEGPPPEGAEPPASAGAEYTEEPPAFFAALTRSCSK